MPTLDIKLETGKQIGIKLDSEKSQIQIIDSRQQ